MNDAAANPMSSGLKPSSSARPPAALRRCCSIFGELPQAFGLPIIAVLHLPDERRSQLAEVFARRLRIPVREARDKEVIAAGYPVFRRPRLSPVGGA